MNPEIRDEWTAALRSGSYDQTIGRLRDEDGFCCLGVLCDIAVKHDVIPDPAEKTPGGAYTYGDDEGGYSYLTLPDSVWVWAGLPSRSPQIPAPEGFSADYEDESAAKLETVNDRVNEADHHVYSFADIADLIDAHL